MAFQLSFSRRVNFFITLVDIDTTPLGEHILEVKMSYLEGSHKEQMFISAATVQFRVKYM